MAEENVQSRAAHHSVDTKTDLPENKAQPEGSTEDTRNLGMGTEAGMDYFVGRWKCLLILMVVMVS